MTSWRRRPISAALLALGLVLLGFTFRGQLDQVFAGTAGHDYQDYFFSTKAFRHGWSIYDLDAATELAKRVPEAGWVPPYVYPPYLTVLFLPISHLRYVPSRVLWLVLSYVFLFAIFDATRRVCALAGKHPVDRRLTWLAAIYTPVLFSPVLDHNWYGQSNLLVLFFVSWGIYFEWKQPFRFPLGALLLATGGLLKLFPLFLFPGYFAMRRFRSAFAIGAWGVVLTGVTLLFIPLDEFLRFPKVLDASMYVATSAEQHYQDHSASSLVRYLAGDTAVPALAIKLLRGVPYAAYLAVFALQGRGTGLATLLRFAQGFVMLAFVMFRWWEHHLVMLVFPFFVAAYACSRLPASFPTARRALTIALAVSAIYIGAVNHPALAGWFDPYFTAAMQGKLPAQLLLFVVLEILIRKYRSLEAAAPASAAAAPAHQS